LAAPVLCHTGRSLLTILATTLPKIKTFLRPAGRAAATRALLIRLVAACLHHPGRMSAPQADGACRSRARHRARSARSRARCHWPKDWAVPAAVADLLPRREAQRQGTGVFLLGQTYVGQQGRETENTFRCGNRRRRPREGRRSQRRQVAKRCCHGFVRGLLLSPGGLRIPCCRCYSTEGYGRDKGLAYKKRPQLAAELSAALAVPEGAEVVAPGDTAFAARDARRACAGRGLRWVVPINPGRVLAGAQPRPQVRSPSAGLSAEHVEAVRLVPGPGAYAAPRRPARCRVGPQGKARTSYVPPQRRAVHDVGDVLLVVSTEGRPQAGRAAPVQKALMTADVSLPAARVVGPYDLRWQIELFFQELEGALGLRR
jgi:hypothetical protein